MVDEKSMNLFILDEDPKVSARYHVDKHVVKMPTETAQMLSFVYHHRECWDKPIPDFIMGYSKTHDKHPCSMWMRKSLDNFLYAATLGRELHREYEYRYGSGKHLRAKMIFDFAINNPPSLPICGLTSFATAMEDVYITSDPIESYRNYYARGKVHLHTWTKREKPFWI